MTMPLLRGGRDDGGTKYQMREKLFSVGATTGSRTRMASVRSRST